MSVIAEETVIEAPAVEAPAEETPIEQPAEETPIEQPAEALPETTEAPAEAEPTKEGDEVKEEVVEEPSQEAAPEPVTFDATAPDLKDNITKVLGDYELPQPVQAAFDALLAKAEAVPTNGFAAFADYAEPDASIEVVESTVKELLDEQVLLNAVRIGENGGLRPETDKFAERYAKKSPDNAAYLFYDLGMLPSDKYQGVNKFGEGIVDNLRIEGESSQTTIARYHQTMAAVKNGFQITGDVPVFIPAQLRDAYWSLAKEDREEIDSFSPEFDRDDDESRRADISGRERKLSILAQIQDGIDSKKQVAQSNAQLQQQQSQQFHQEVQTTQETFYGAFRQSVTEDVIKNVKFSDNPKLNLVLAHQNVSLLGDALMPGAIGDNARSVLSEAGISFDVAKANQLQREIELASVQLAQAKKKGGDGNVLNPIELNKATSQFRKTTEAFQAFAKNILDQEARLVSTGNAEAVKVAAEKIKVAPKTRAVAKGVGSQSHTQKQNPHRYGTPDYYEYQAEETMREREARKAQAYA